jgi:hypothetical protein
MLVVPIRIQGWTHVIIHKINHEVFNMENEVTKQINIKKTTTNSRGLYSSLFLHFKININSNHTTQEMRIKRKTRKWPKKTVYYLRILESENLSTDRNKLSFFDLRFLGTPLVSSNCLNFHFIIVDILTSHY